MNSKKPTCFDIIDAIVSLWYNDDKIQKNNIIRRNWELFSKKNNLEQPKITNYFNKLDDNHMDIEK